LTKETSVDVELSLNDERGQYAKGRELNKWGAGSLRGIDRPCGLLLRHLTALRCIPFATMGKKVGGDSEKKASS